MQERHEKKNTMRNDKQIELLHKILSKLQSEADDFRLSQKFVSWSSEAPTVVPSSRPADGSNLFFQTSPPKGSLVCIYFLHVFVEVSIHQKRILFSIRTGIHSDSAIM